MREKLAVVILNYKTYELTLNLIKQLREIVGGDIGIIVVDNDSKNKSSEILRDFSDMYCYEFIQSDENGGYAKGNNIGIKFSRKLGYEYVLIMNNDILIKDGKVIDGMLDVMQKDKSIGAISPRLVEKNGAKSPPIYYKKPSFGDLTFGMQRYRSIRYRQDDEKIYQIYAPRGSFMLLRNSMLEKIGDLDENTFLFYEEPILAERLELIDAICLHYGVVSVVHMGSETIRTTTKKKEMLNYLCESYRYYLNKYRNMGKVKTEICVIFRRLVALRH